MDFTTKPPVCFGERNGSITILQIQGGAGPYAISLNNQPGQSTDVFPKELNNLAAGSYQLLVSDINGCESMVTALINEAPMLTVSLGPDTSIYFGDSIVIDAIVSSTAIDSFVWSPIAGLKNPMLLTTEAKPGQSTVYKIWVRDTTGCRAEDDLLVTVLREKRVYIPNSIHPGSENGNETLAVFAGPEVRRIKTFRVYDRWGSCVFEKTDLEPNQPSQGWTGQWRGKDAAPGVYVYVADLEYFDGSTEVISGDVTLVR